MSEIRLRDYFSIQLVDSMGSDELICKAARVSTLGSASIDTEESEGLIKFLMRNRHGSPFEHGSMTFRIEAPIFVWRAFMRHRIGFSYNEQSGRYMEMMPVFYIPMEERPLVQQGRPGHYDLVPGDMNQFQLVGANLSIAYEQAWDSYRRMLAEGIAKEVARMCLPVGIYSTAYVTCNPRSLMNFLSLRTKNDISVFPSFPQWEIEEVARNMEELFAELFPLTHRAFMDCGRVAP